MSELSSAFPTILAEVEPPVGLRVLEQPPGEAHSPGGALVLPPPLRPQASPFAPLDRPPPAAQVALAAGPPEGFTVWLEPHAADVEPQTLPQALWFAFFARHRSRLLVNARTQQDEALLRSMRTYPQPASQRETDLLRELIREDTAPITVAWADVDATFTPDQLSLPQGVTALRQWLEPQLVPSFMNRALAGERTEAAFQFLTFLMGQLAAGEHFIGLAALTGVPAHMIMRFLRAMTDGDPPRAAALQHALDDGVDVATAAFAAMAEDKTVADETLERTKQALVARRDLVLRLRESRYAPPAAATRAGMRVSAGGMQIDFTFDTSAPLPSTKFHRSDALTVDVATKELK